MFTVVELSRTQVIDTFHAADAPFVVAAKLYYGATNEDIATFWTTTFGVDEPTAEETNIIGVVYDNTVNYAPKNSYSEMLLDERSFYWDQNEQTIYIHLIHNQQIGYVEENFAYGLAFGVTDDKVRYFNNKAFLPLLKSAPSIDYSVDKLEYDKLDFAYGRLIFNNIGGEFNQFKETPIYGNKVLIKTGNEGDTYDDLIFRREYYVEDYEFSVVDFLVDIQDPRKALSTQLPNKFFNTTAYPNIGDNSIGSPIPFAYGQLRDVPGYCINEQAVNGTTSPVFIFSEIITNVSEVWVKDNDVWTSVSFTPNYTTGEVTIPSARKLSGSTYDILRVKANIIGVAVTYASDIIKDINDRFLGITFDSSNYDLVQWAAEEVYLDPVGLYIDKVQDLFDYIRKLQGASTVGFKYDLIKGKRTIIIDNPNKNIAFDIPSQAIFNIRDVVAESNKEDMYNKIAIGYDYSLEFDTATRAENDTYFKTSFDQYKIIKVFDPISGLLSSSYAANRAKIQAEDLHLIRRIFELRLYGEEYLDAQIFDLANVTIDIEYFKVKYNTILQGLRNSSMIVQGTLTSTDIVSPLLSIVESYIERDELFGEIRGQIISVKPEYRQKFTTIRLRERPYSVAWEEVYGS